MYYMEFYKQKKINICSIVLLFSTVVNLPAELLQLQGICFISRGFNVILVNYLTLTCMSLSVGHLHYLLL